MFYETPAADLTGVDLLSEHLGGGWDFIKSSITPENASRFINAYNLLALNETWGGSDEEDSNNEEDTLPLEIQHIIIDESLTITEQTEQIRSLLLNNIIDRLVKIGLVLDTSYITNEHFDILVELFDIVFILYNYEDLQSLSEILEQQDIPSVDRYFEVVKRVKGLTNEQLEPFYYIVTDVEENLLETLAASLIHPDAEPETPDYVIKRVMGNKAFLLDETIAGEHIRGNGMIGKGINSLRSFYRPELNAHLEESPVEFIRQIIAMTLISTLTNEEITPYLADVIKAECDEIDIYYRAEAILKEIHLEGVDHDAD